MRLKGKEINPCTLPIPEGTYNIIYFHLSPSVDLKEAMSMSLPLAPRGAVFVRVSPTNLLDSFKLIEAWGFEYRTGMVVILPGEYSNPWMRGQHDLVLVCCRRGKPFVPDKYGRKAVIFSSVLDTRSPITTEVTVTDMIMAKLRNQYPGCRFLKAELDKRGRQPAPQGE